MERLTYKNYIEEYEVNFEKSSDKNWSIAESNTHIKVTGEPIEKLGELEDVLEEFELTSAEDLRNYLNFKRNMAIWEGELNYKNKIADLEQELAELKQQLHDSPKKIVEEIKDCLLDFSNGWWRYFMTDGCEYMLSSDLQGCLDEIIDTILKKYGVEDE